MRKVSRLVAFVLLIPSARRKTQWNLYLTRRNEICTPLNRPDFSPNLSGKRGKAFRFTNAWEQRKLGAIVQITMGQSPDGSTYSDTPADYILVQGNADLKNGWVCPRVWTTQKTKFATAALSVKITFATLSVLHGVVKHAIFAGVYR